MEYVLNMETKKLELTSTREEYRALSADIQREIKSAFLFSRKVGGWVSRSMYPNTHRAEQAAKKAGAIDRGRTGERLSFSEQMEQKAERAERRADRMEYRAEQAEKRAEELQKPINDMHGDIAFFTQPNINSSAGRAFTRRRERMWSSYKQGWEEFKKSEYYQERAEAARQTAKTAKKPDRAFCQRRIEDAQKDIRAYERSITEYENYLSAIEKGETPRNKYGWEMKVTAESCERNISRWLDLMEQAMEKEIYYREIQEEQGGVQFSRENIKPGYIVELEKSWYGPVEVLSVGPKNFSYKSSAGFSLKASYAEIKRVLKAEEKKADPQPFKVGEEFTEEYRKPVYSEDGRYQKSEYEKHILRVVKATEKSVTLEDTSTGKTFSRKPKICEVWDGSRVAYLNLSNDYTSTYIKKPVQQAAA